MGELLMQVVDNGPGVIIVTNPYSHSQNPLVIIAIIQILICLLILICFLILLILFIFVRIRTIMMISIMLSYH